MHVALGSCTLVPVGEGVVSCNSSCESSSPTSMLLELPLFFENTTNAFSSAISGCLARLLPNSSKGV